MQLHIQEAVFSLHIYFCKQVAQNAAMLENFVASIERHQAAVSARFEAFCMEKLQNEYSSGIVSGPNMKQLIVFNQLYAASEIGICMALGISTVALLIQLNHNALCLLILVLALFDDP
jgi:hypothetical protein